MDVAFLKHEKVFKSFTAENLGLYLGIMNYILERNYTG